MDTKKLRQKILDLAIRGKLVPQDPNDEPASVLLERIKAEKERLIKEGKIKRSKKTAKTSDTPHYENVQFEVPSSWEWTTFGSICKKLTDGSHNPPPKRSNGYTVISAQNIKNGKIIFTDKDRYTDEIGFQKENPRTQITKGDIILGIIGGSIGNVAIYDLSDPVVAQRSISIIDTYVLNIYCFYLLQSTIFQSLFLEKSIGNAQAGIYLGELDKLYIPLPPIREQNRIVSEIKRWFTLIDEIEQGKADLQTTIKQIKSKILDLAIHGKLVPQDPNDEPASELLKRINPKAEITCDNAHYQNLLFEVPQNWCWTILGKIGKWQSGSTPSRLNKNYYNGNIPWLKTGDLNDGYITHIPEYITEKALNETSVKLNPAGSVLIAMYGATIGKIGILTFPATTNQACCACKVFNVIDKEFLFFFLLSHREEFIKMGGGGAQPNISKEKIVNTYIPLPPFAEQRRIVNAVNKEFTLLDAIMESL
ncbi:restriction endonuclease subunit S [Phocaeicola sp. HCN-40430]|uniref:restriction endonuclease subunit S n=1 Tax=Phocaeicola sp. HCN-40430 TaxID=3134664 RepID=UPI0030C4E7C7